MSAEKKKGDLDNNQREPKQTHLEKLIKDAPWLKKQKAEQQQPGPGNRRPKHKAEKHSTETKPEPLEKPAGKSSEVFTGAITPGGLELVPGRVLAPVEKAKSCFRLLHRLHSSRWLCYVSVYSWETMQKGQRGHQRAKETQRCFVY